MALGDVERRRGSESPRIHRMQEDEEEGRKDCFHKPPSSAPSHSPVTDQLLQSHHKSSSSRRAVSLLPKTPICLSAGHNFADEIKPNRPDLYPNHWSKPS